MRRIHLSDRKSIPLLLKPEHISSIQSLNLVAKFVVEGMIAGMHKSPYHGFSSEFLEFRQYRDGESTKNIDWRKEAKTEKSFVRVFEDETNLTANILIDASASMGFSYGDRISKFEYARVLAASLAWILIRQRDLTGLIIFDENIREQIRPGSTNLKLREIIGTLQNSECLSRTNSPKAFSAAVPFLKKRGLTIVISDFLEEPDSILEALRHLKYQNQEVVAVRVLDPLEVDFNIDGAVYLNDLETGSKINIDSDVIKKVYGNSFAEHKKKIVDGMHDFHTTFVETTTERTFAETLQVILNKRGRLF